MRITSASSRHGIAISTGPKISSRASRQSFEVSVNTVEVWVNRNSFRSAADLIAACNPSGRSCLPAALCDSYLLLKRRRRALELELDLLQGFTTLPQPLCRGMAFKVLEEFRQRLC